MKAFNILINSYIIENYCVPNTTDNPFQTEAQIRRICQIHVDIAIVVLFTKTSIGNADLKCAL